MSKIIEWVKLNLTPNRIAALAAFFTALATLLLDLEGSFHTTKLGVALIAIAALATKASVVLKYLSGSQAWDIIQAGAHPKTGEPLPLPPGITIGAPWTGYPAGDPTTDVPPKSPVTPPGVLSDVGPVAEGQEFPTVEKPAEEPKPHPRRKRG